MLRNVFQGLWICFHTQPTKHVLTDGPLRSLQTAVRYFVAFWKSEFRRPRRDREERERERERARDPVATLRKSEKIDPDPKNNNPDEIPACSVQT